MFLPGNLSKHPGPSHNWRMPLDEQLERARETLETDQAERLVTALPTVVATVETAAETQKPARRALPEHLPREDLSAFLRACSDEVYWAVDE